MKDFFKRLLILIASFLPMLAAYSQPLDADIIVDINGSGDFTTLQAAIDAVPSNSDITTVIYIKRGLYNMEKLIVPAEKKKVILIGESREETIISYGVHNCSDGGDGLCPDEKVALWSGDNIRTAATLTIMADDFRAENLTIENTAGPVGQAQAITIRGDRAVFVNCDLKGYQDTIYLWLNQYTYRAYFEKCLIVGRTDYIYGHGIGFFNECEIRSWGGGWITAPATDESQEYGFVFYKCALTYATGSPRSGDDGNLVRLGRPWHNYPKVAWLYCDMTEMIHPEGWGDKWNMDYSDTDIRLHLYEYQNTGPGADMSGRADWAGLRAMTAEEAPNYEPEIVLAGTDNWDPTATPPAVTVYEWTGGGSTTSWLTAENWNPVATPASGEAAIADGNDTLTADGGTFSADLSLLNGAHLDIAENSTVTLLSIGKAGLGASGTISLAGTIRTKDTVFLDVAGDLTIAAQVIGVHTVIKKGAGTASLTHDNEGFAGNWVIEAGTLKAPLGNSIGSAEKLTVGMNGTLVVDDNNAFHPTTALYTQGNAQLTLNADITISEWYIDGAMQPLGTYSSATHPSVISGTGSLTIGRPSQFIFIGGDNGNWDNPAHFSPALLPQAGETVIVEREIEAQSTPFLANMIVRNGGVIRLRSANSVCEGTITMHQSTQIRYATSGTGFTLNAPIVLAGDIVLGMNSANTNGSVMNLPGTFEGSYKVIVTNTRTDALGSATVDLGGDNSAFTGTWDLNTPSATEGAVTAINGLAENAFGKGRIVAASINEVIFSHRKCAGDTLDLTLTESAKAVLNADVRVNEFTLNGEKLPGNAVYDATTHPDLFTGEGSIGVDIQAYNLNLTISGSGTVEASEAYDEGSEVTLTAVPDEGWTFESWTGDIESTDPTIVFTMDSEKELTATFTTITGFFDEPAAEPKIYLSHGKLYVKGTNNGIRIYSLAGRQVYINENEHESEMDLSHLRAGVYIVRFVVDRQAGATKILIP